MTEEIRETRGEYTFVIAPEISESFAGWYSFVYKNGELIEKMPHRDKDEAAEHIAVNWIGG